MLVKLRICKEICNFADVKLAFINRYEDTDLQHPSMQSGEDRQHLAKRRGHYGIARMCVSGSSLPTRWL